MAKQISQETFDAIVKENIDEFDMEPAEAIQDAVSQFEAQGINLSNIVKDLSLQTGGSAEGDTPVTHPVVQAIDTLTKAMQDEVQDVQKVQSACAKITSECNIDLAHRCLAGKNGAYPVLLNHCEKFHSDPLMLKVCINTICSLCNGQPDLLNEKGIQLFLGWVKQHAGETKLVLALVKLVRLTCTMHETNRQDYVRNGVISVLMQTLEDHKLEADVVKETCVALRTLMLDDDIRVPFGKAHDHAKMIVTEENALRRILDICKEYPEDKVILGELFSTLGRLAVRNEFCQEIMDAGGLGLMLQVMQDNMEHAGLMKQTMVVLKAIAGNDQVKRATVNGDGIQLILAAMTRHHTQAALCEMGCAAIATLSLRSPVHCKVVMESGGAEILLRCMQIHPQQAALQKQACMAIRNIVARSREYCPEFVELGAEGLVQKAIADHKDCHDEAKAALRDLGCKVHLKELWSGEGKEIAQ